MKLRIGWGHGCGLETQFDPRIPGEIGKPLLVPSFTRVQRSVTEGCHLIGRVPAPSVKGNFEARSYGIDFVVQRCESLLFGIAGSRVTASLAVDEKCGRPPVCVFPDAACDSESKLRKFQSDPPPMG